MESHISVISVKHVLYNEIAEEARNYVLWKIMSKDKRKYLILDRFHTETLIIVVNKF